MNEDNVMEEKEEMKEEIKDNEKLEDEGKEPATATEAEEVKETEQEAEEKPIMPLKKVNRFFLTALFPLAFILIFGIVLLVSGLGKEGKEAVNATSAKTNEAEEDYYAVKDDELRGVYVATVYNFDYPSKQTLGAAALKEELDQMLIFCAQNGFNAVYFQVSPYSDALYSSEILPVSHVLTGTEGGELPEGFDPLEYLCDAAHKIGIEAHAWVNPVRVTAGGFDPEELSADNPACVYPEYTVTYNGELYYNLGVPEVRNLQARVCAELAEKYAVDGILFDDYFYPYPEDGEVFDDAAAYKQHGGDYATVEDFRRASATALVTECYDAIKATRPECRFGVAPFGIWRNDDGTNGGSATRGLESYESLYCDTLSFIKAGKVDYIAPQIYWTFETAVAPYGELCDWWADAVKGTEVELLISHAAYQASEWNTPEEYIDQVEYARTKRAYGGSLFYRYKFISANEGGITEAFTDIYEE